jgi:5-methyltetrahydrofolate--homocysteine methyltransferase
VRDRIRVLVGGAPVTQAYADEIGAEGYGEDASDAVATANRLMDIWPRPGADRS